MIDQQVQDKTFFPTRAVTEGVKVLEENGVLIYTGVAGSGKTTNATGVIKQFLESNPCYISLNVDDVTQWRTYVNPERKTLLLLDDFLGSTNMNKSLLNEGRKYWGPIYTSIQTGKLKVILTIRNHILNESLTHLENNMLFSGRHIVNISSDEYKLNKTEKLEMIKLHFKCNKINIVGKKCEENYTSDDILHEEKTVTINQWTVDKIIESDPLMGFPQALFLFCTSRKYTRLGERFFLRPTDSLLKEMEHLRLSNEANERLQYCILTYMLLKGKQTNLNEMDDKTWETVVGIFPLIESATKIAIKDAAKSITNKYIMNVDKTYIYTFKHQTILEAVALSLGLCKIELLLKSCDEDFINEFIRTKQYDVKEGEVVLMLKSTSEYEWLAQRFLHDLMTIKNYIKYWWVAHSALDDPEFISCSIDKIQSNEVLMGVIKQSCSKCEGLFNRACLSDKCLLVDKLYTLFPEEINTHSCLFHASSCNAISTTNWLLDHKVGTGDIVKALACAHTEILYAMLNHRNVNLTHVTQVIDEGAFYCIDVKAVEIILNRWRDKIKSKYVDKLLSYSRHIKAEECVEVLENFKGQPNRKNEEFIQVQISSH